MPLSSDNRIMALQLLAECGRVSRQGLLDIMPYSYRNKCLVIKKLVDDKLIGAAGNSRADESYSLLKIGRDELSRLNSQRYTPDLFELNNLLKQHPEQSRLCGDIAAAMSLAGYAVHPADKPILPAVTPDYEAYTPDTMKSIYRNERPHIYGEIFPNHTRYTRRITPVNCYYDRSQIKLTRESVTYNASRNARAAGALFTPTHLFRVYHGEDSNIKFFRNGEEHFYSLLEEVFKGYRPPEKKAVLLFGRDFAPAESLLDIHLNNKRDVKNKGILLGPSNLGAPLHYLPLSARAQELLRVMRYPDWHMSITTFASEIRFGIRGRQAWVYDHEGRRVYIVADLNLTHMATALRQIAGNPKRRAVFLCLPWQAEFIEEQTRFYSDDNPLVELDCLPADFLTKTTIQVLENYWGC